MKTLKEFRNTAVPMTKAAFENVYGVTDVRAPKVIVYGGGYYIDCFPDGGYGVIYMNQDFESTSLFAVEEILWDAHVAGEVVERNDHAIMFEDMVNRYAFRYRIKSEANILYTAKFVEARMRGADADNQLGGGILHSFIANLDSYNHNKFCREVDEFTAVINDFMKDKDGTIEDCFNSLDDTMKVVRTIESYSDYTWSAASNLSCFKDPKGNVVAESSLNGIGHNTFFAVGLIIKELKK